MKHVISYIIIFLSSVMIGMIFGLVVLRRGPVYHGPKASEQVKKIYYHCPTNSFIQFQIQPLKCPKPKTKLQKMISRLRKSK